MTPLLTRTPLKMRLFHFLDLLLLLRSPRAHLARYRRLYLSNATHARRGPNDQKCKTGVGTNVRRRGRGHHLPIGLQRRIIKSARIVHRGGHIGPHEAFLAHCRGWCRVSLLLLGEGELGHVGTERFGGAMTSR
jgi:hypothetical protein